MMGLYDDLVFAYKDLRSHLVRKVGNAFDAADLAQSSFEQAMRYAQHNQVVSARSLLFQIARNLQIDKSRRDRLVAWESLEQKIEDHGALHEPADTASSPERIVSARMLLVQLSAAVDALPPRCREAFLLSRVDGLSHEQVAHRMGISLSQVEKYIVRGLRACREAADRQDTV